MMDNIIKLPLFDVPEFPTFRYFSVQKSGEYAVIKTHARASGHIKTTVRRVPLRIDGKLMVSVHFDGSKPYMWINEKIWKCERRP